MTPRPLFWGYNYLSLTFGKLYEDTIARENILKNAGYKIVSVWESDIR